ncbi:MAG TPA: V-type ATP synthase subunit E [Candidatus Scatomorpha pullistercoris]|uniref:V-type ATP synthase subunit E n=1 Tax=Candidatus Scatomorpha pullistercoris TaxID=2840929 RepID=A0A9D1KAQ4_9FIRM|nr:V-type ATP synthase subunit E [Candidatus Scatomorpha pullistercoris]
MQERKSKLADFTAAVTGAASAKAAEMNAETERLEREALDEYASALRSAAEKRRASALADAKVRENKRIVAEGLASKRSLLQFREDCADDVFNEVRARILELPKKPEYADTLKNQLWRALDAVPGAREARVWLRREDMGFAHGLNSASPGVRLEFLEGSFVLGGLILECPEKNRKIDLSFDAALEDLEGRFSELTGFSLEDADGE